MRIISCSFFSWACNSKFLSSSRLSSRLTLHRQLICFSSGNIELWQITVVSPSKKHSSMLHSFDLPRSQKRDLTHFIFCKEFEMNTIARKLLSFWRRFIMESVLSYIQTCSFAKQQKVLSIRLWSSMGRGAQRNESCYSVIVQSLTCQLQGRFWLLCCDTPSNLKSNPILHLLKGSSQVTIFNGSPISF